MLEPAVAEDGSDSGVPTDDSSAGASAGAVADKQDRVMHSGGKSRLFGRQKPLYLVLGGGKGISL